MWICCTLFKNETMSLIPLVLLIIIPPLFVLFNFIFYLKKNRIKTGLKLFRVIEIWTILILPTFFILISDIGKINECCTDSALFSPEHRIGIYLLIIMYIFSYIISIFRKSILPPIAETFINSFLILGIIINIIFCIHINKTELGGIFWVFGNIPIILLLLMKLNENQKLLKHEIEQNNLNSNNLIGKLCLNLLSLKPVFKYSILTILLVPIIILLSLFLILFGQKPDSLIKSFTETYKHGFSELDYMCDNVQCGGHFLCSVGANGHIKIVNPIRYGERNGNKIICNRQLLVSNAFEELIQEKMPKTHNFIRKQYNNVGNIVHKYYFIFNNKYVSDFVYILMKPLELCFLLVLYTFEKKPENRIEKQYISKGIRKKINSVQHR